MKNYNNAYMAELSEKEMMENNGGMPWLIPLVAGAILCDVLLNPKESWETIKEGWEAGKR